MRSIVQSSLKLRYLVVLLGVAVAVAGVARVRSAPVDTFPEFAPPYVEIQTEALGLSAEEVEQLITVPLEADLLNGIPGADVLESKSVEGLSSIVLIFHDGTSLLDARQLVQERMTQAHALPNVSKPPAILQPLSSESRALIVGLQAKNLSLLQQSVLARWTIAPRLLAVPGVANVSVFGQRDRQMQVLVDPARLRDKDVSLLQIVRTTGNAQLVSPLSFLEASTPGTGGFIDSPNQRLGIRHVFPISKPKDLAGVPIEGGGPKAPLLGDVATVVEDHQPLIGDALVGDKPSLLLVVDKLPGANTLKVTHGVEQALAELQPGLSGMTFDSTVFRPATFIGKALDNLAFVVIFGALLAALVLGAFLFNWRAALITIVTVPAAFLAALLVLTLRGTTMNALVVGGLAVALLAIVDDAIVDVENITRRLHERRATGEKTDAILEASLEVRRPIVFATLLIVLAALPAYAIGGLSGALLHPLATSYILAVLASMLVALTLTPALSLLLLSRGGRESPLGGPLRAGYEHLLERIMRAPRLVFAGLAVVAALALAVGPSLSRSHLPALLPSFKEGDVLVHFDAAPGTSLPEMRRIVARATREVRGLDGVRNVAAHIGRAVGSDQIVGVNSAELWVSIDPKADYEGTTADVDRIVHAYPGLAVNALSYANQRLQDAGNLSSGDTSDGLAGAPHDALTGSHKDVVVRLFGQDPALLERNAKRVEKLVAGVRGVANPRIESQALEPALDIEVNLQAARRYGIKPGDVRRAATSLLSGISVGSLFEQQKVFEVVVRGTPATQHSLTSVRDLLIDTPTGGHVRLADVAAVRVRPTPTVIERDAVERFVEVTADAHGRALGAVLDDVRDRLSSLALPLEYHAEVLRDSVDNQAKAQRLVLLALAALLGIFLLLQAAFGSWRLAGLFFLTLPMALAGGVLGALAGGGVLTLGSVIGFLAVLAVAVRNGIVLISRCQQLERGEGEALGPALVMRGAQERVSPILTTACATAFALLPVVFIGDVPGTEIVHPMAVVALGGLVTSTLVTLFAVPVLCARPWLGRAEQEESALAPEAPPVTGAV